MAPRFSSSCTQTRITSASTSTSSATPAAQVSGDIFSLNNEENTRSAKNLQGIENACQLARITHDTCTSPRSHPSPHCRNQSLTGESANAATDTLRTHYNIHDARTSEAKPKHRSSSYRQENLNAITRSVGEHVHVSLPPTAED